MIRKPMPVAELSAYPHRTLVVSDERATIPGSEWVTGLKDADPADAQLISSEIVGMPDWHTPMLDIDLPARLVPSSTEGNFHLYIDAPMKWGTYLKLLKALAETGIIQKGYYEASVARKATTLRLPWVRKSEDDGLGGSE